MVSTLFAQRTHRGDVTIEAGFNLNSHREYLMGGLLRSRYFLTDKWVLRGDFTYTGIDSSRQFLRYADSSEMFGTYANQSDIFRLGLGVERQFRLANHLYAFTGLSLGAGIGNSDFQGDNADRFIYRYQYMYSSTENVFRLSAIPFVGLDYWLSKRWYVGAEVSYPIRRTMLSNGSATESIYNNTNQYNLPKSQFNSTAGWTPYFRVGFAVNGNRQDDDGDGISNKKDKCPDTPEGVDVTRSGCPKIVEQVSVLAKNIYFESDSDVIKSTSYKALDQVAAILKDYGKSTLKIEGHTDNTGSATHNQDLSQRRAQAVMKYLTEKGIDASRMSATGFGQDNPIAPNNTKEGRALNRRVELILIF
jgi:outer membrane protein OmpA-like peptidoglycan-associated protein